MTLRFCTHCWQEQPAQISVCAHCGAPVAGPEGNGVPYTEKLLQTLRGADAEASARAALILGRIGDQRDERIGRALITALRTDPVVDLRVDLNVQVAAALALAELDICEASEALSALAVRDDTPLLSGLCAIEALTELAHNGCAQATWDLERIAREAGRGALQMEASRGLARLNEPG